MGRCQEERVRLGQPRQFGHMPEMIAVQIGAPLCCQQVERRDAQTLQPFHIPAIGAIGSGIAAQRLFAPAQPL